jgi:hypothetical protein
LKFFYYFIVFSTVLSLPLLILGQDSNCQEPAYPVSTSLSSLQRPETQAFFEAVLPYIQNLSNIYNKDNFLALDSFSYLNNYSPLLGLALLALIGANVANLMNTSKKLEAIKHSR